VTQIMVCARVPAAKRRRTAVPKWYMQAWSTPTAYVLSADAVADAVPALLIVNHTSEARCNPYTQSRANNHVVRGLSEASCLSTVGCIRSKQCRVTVVLQVGAGRALAAQ
jgi:hypothetical protein